MPISSKDTLNNSLISYINIFITSNKFHYLIITSIIVLIAYFFLRLPILSIGDTDLWYHLSGGRYFFQNNMIPRSGFFSFLAESREWTNYYWFFQVIVYRIYRLTGYHGLVILKAMIFVITVSAIASFLLKGEKNEKQIFYFILIFILLSIGLLPRYYAFLRPHICSYLFIVTFIYLIEFRPRPIIFLPVLSALWANVHGIEYPVIVLIGFSYLFEYFIKLFKKDETFTRTDLYFLIPIVLSLWTILINPYGIELLRAPFNFAEHQHHYIKELNPISIEDFFTFKLIPLMAIPESILKVLIVLACVVCINGMFKQKIRISHLLLLIGGLILVTRAQRFQYEAVLLALPILKFQPLVYKENKSDSISFYVRISIAVIIILFSFFYFFRVLDTKAKYPFSYSHFPHGVIAFLNHIDSGGSILNSPDWGGYLQWALNPQYKIAMDLQMMLFSDEDYFIVANALSTREGFASFKKRFYPDFVIVKRGHRNFKAIIEFFPEYKPVYFDNASILYAREKSHSGFLEQYGLKVIDPYSIMEEDIDTMSERQTKALLDELSKIHAIYPKGMLTNFEMGRIYKKMGNIDKAHTHADTIINNYPEFPNGFALKGDISVKSDLYKDAVSWYKAALNCPIKYYTPLLYKKLAFAYSKLGEHKKAYRNMQKGVDIFSPSTQYKDLWQLGNMALVAGNIEDGMMLLRFAILKTPDEDEAFSKRVRRQLEKLKMYLEK